MATGAADAAPGTGRYYTSTSGRKENFGAFHGETAKGRPRIETALFKVFLGWLLLLHRLSTINHQLRAIPGSGVGGAHELHFNNAVGYLVVNIHAVGCERFDRAALQGKLVAFKKRKLDTVSGPLRAGQRSGGSGLGGSGSRGSAFSSGSRGGFRRGSGGRFGSRRNFNSRRCFFRVAVRTGRIGGRSGTTSSVAIGGRSAATGHNGDHNEAQQAQKNFAHLFTLSIFC